MKIAIFTEALDNGTLPGKVAQFITFSTAGTIGDTCESIPLAASH